MPNLIFPVSNNTSPPVIAVPTCALILTVATLPETVTVLISTFVNLLLSVACDTVLANLLDSEVNKEAKI